MATLRTRETRRPLLIGVLAGLLLLAGGLADPAAAGTRAATTLTLAAPASVAYNGSAVLSGKLAKRGGGVLGGRVVALYRQRPGTSTWAKITSARTTSTGRYSSTVRNLQGHVAFQARYAGATKLKAVTSATRRTTVRAPLSAITVTPSATQAVVGDQRTFSGTTAPTMSGHAAEVQRLSGSSWLPAGSAPIGSAGSFAVPVTLDSSGTKSYRVSIPASATLLATASPAIALQVSERPPAADPLEVLTSFLADGRVGEAYAESLDAWGGEQPYAWDKSTGSLPAGVTLGSDGALHGTPTAPGTSTFTVRVTDHGGQHATADLSIDVSPAPLSITTTSPLPGATQQTAYSKQLVASGGQAPLSWSVVDGTLPEGLALSTAGLLSGTPTGTGPSSFKVQVVDGLSDVVTRDYTLEVSAPVTPVLGDATLPEGQVGVGYAYRPTVTGGTAPYTWSITTGTLPGGLSLDGSTGLLSGTPTTPGTSTATLQVKDAANHSTTKALPFKVSVGAAWNQERADAAQSGYLPDEATVTAANAGRIGLERSTAGETAEAVVDGVVYAGATLPGSLSQGLTARDVSTGNLLWAERGPADNWCAHIAVTASLVICDTSLAVAAFQRGGQHDQVWSSNDTYPGLQARSIVVTGDRVLVGTANDGSASQLVSLNVVDGSFQWSRTLTGSVDHLSVSVPDDSVYATVTPYRTEDPAPTVKAWSLTGSQRWSVASTPMAIIATTGHLLTVDSHDASLRSAASGAVEDTFTSNVPIYGEPAVDATTAYLPTAEFSDGGGWSYSGVTAVRLSDLTQRWRMETDYPVRAGMLVAGGLLWVHASDLARYRQPSELDVVDVSTGAVVRRLQPDDTGSVAPVAGGGRVFVQKAHATDVYGVMAPAPQAVRGPVPTAWTGTAYSTTLEVHGGTAPYTWSVRSGTVPAGLSLSATGAVTGTPTTAGATDFVARARDAAGRAADLPVSVAVRTPGPVAWRSQGLDDARNAAALNASGYDGDSLSGFATRWASTPASDGSSSTGTHSQEPLVAGGRVFAVRGDGSVAAFDSAGTGTGKTPLWTSTTTDGLYAATPTLVGSATVGTLYVFRSDNRVCALSAASGALAWCHDYGGAVAPYGSAGPVVVGGRLLAELNGHVVAVDTTTHEQVWDQDLPSGHTDSYGLAVAGGRVFAFDSCYVVALDAATGDFAWTTGDAANPHSVQVGPPGSQCGGFVRMWGSEPRTSPVVVDGVVYAADPYDGMAAIDATSGTVLWRNRANGDQPAPVVTERWIVSTNSNDRSLLVQDRGNGVVVNQRQLAFMPLGSPTLVGDVVLISDGTRIRGFDVSTLENVWTSTDLTGASPYAAVGTPVVSDGRLWVYNSDGRVLGLGT